MRKHGVTARAFSCGALPLALAVWAVRCLLMFADAAGRLGFRSAQAGLTAGVKVTLQALRTAWVLWSLTLRLLHFLGFQSWGWILLACRLVTFALLLSPAWAVLVPEYLRSGKIRRGVKYGHHRRNDADVYEPPDGVVFCTCAASAKKKMGSASSISASNDRDSDGSSGNGGGVASNQHDDNGKDHEAAGEAVPCTCDPSRRPVLLCFCGGAWVIGYKFWTVAL